MGRNVEPISEEIKLTMLSFVSVHILNKWLKHYKEEIGEKTALIYYVKQAKIVFEKLGIPYSIAA